MSIILYLTATFVLPVFAKKVLTFDIVSVHSSFIEETSDNVVKMCLGTFTLSQKENCQCFNIFSNNGHFCKGISLPITHEIFLYKFSNLTRICV